MGKALTTTQVNAPIEEAANLDHMPALYRAGAREYRGGPAYEAGAGWVNHQFGGGGDWWREQRLNVRCYRSSPSTMASGTGIRWIVAVGNGPSGCVGPFSAEIDELAAEGLIEARLTPDQPGGVRYWLTKAGRLAAAAAARGTFRRLRHD